MSATGLDVFDSTLQQTNTWLKEIMDELRWEDRRRAYEALRGTLHALRDHLPVDEAAHLAAQLPVLVRGSYYEGWDPSRVPVRERRREDFLQRVQAAFTRGDPAADPARAAHAVLGVLNRHLTAGQVAQVRDALPEDVRGLWPEPSQHARAA